MRTYFGFALANGMFSGNCTIKRRVLTVDQVKELIAEGVTSCCNKFHTATVKELTERFDIHVDIPENLPLVQVNSGESIIVMGVKGLPRLENRQHYTDEEISHASFEFVLYTVE